MQPGQGGLWLLGLCKSACFFCWTALAGSLLQYRQCWIRPPPAPRFPSGRGGFGDPRAASRFWTIGANGRSPN